jgi:hypothetical protein
VFDEPLNAENGLPFGPGESVVPTVKVSDPNYSPINVGIALVVMVIGSVFIVSRGLRKRPDAERVAKAS